MPLDVRVHVDTPDLDDELGYDEDDGYDYDDDEEEYDTSYDAYDEDELPDRDGCEW